jgi:peptide/nickel transport system substrate-binding protein
MVETAVADARALADDPAVEIARYESSAYRELHLRVDREPWKDKRVRQALAYCLDRDALVQTLFAGYAVPANDHGFAPSFGAAPEEGAPEQRSQDHERAKALLAEAGHPGGLEVRLTVPDSLDIPRYAELVREQCLPAGIDVEVRVVDVNAYYGAGERQPWLEVPFGCIDWAARGLPSQLIAPAYTCEGAFNSAHWCHEEFDRTLAELEAELDPGRRRELATRAAEIQHDEVPAVIAFWIAGVRAKRKEVAGLDGPFADLATAAFRAV